MDRWPIFRADAGGALLSAAARGAGCGADCVAAWLRLPGVSGRPAIGATVRSIGRWLAAGLAGGRCWPLALAALTTARTPALGVGGVDELELLELLLWRTPASAAA